MAKNDEDINAKEMIKTIVESNKAGLSPEEVKMQEEAMIKIFEYGMLPAEALGFNQNFLDYVYGYAYSLYQQNKFEEARQLNLWLRAMDFTNPIYLIALAHCCMQQKKWLEASTYFFELAIVNTEDPYPYEQMCECFVKANDLASALVSIEKAIERAGDHEKYAHDKARWIMTYENILSQLNIDPAIIEKVRAERKANNL